MLVIVALSGTLKSFTPGRRTRYLSDASLDSESSQDFKDYIHGSYPGALQFSCQVIFTTFGIVSSKGAPPMTVAASSPPTPMAIIPMPPPVGCGCQCPGRSFPARELFKVDLMADAVSGP